MFILFTGLIENVCVELMRSLKSGSDVRVVPPEKALAASEIQGAKRVVWFYRSPWAMPQAFVSGSTENSVGKQFDDWLKWNRMLLRKRRALGDRLVLVNIERMDYSQLMAFLEIQGDHSGTSNNGGISAGERAISTLLAEPFAAIAPEHWDVFELLETLAWRPTSSADDLAAVTSLSKDTGVQILQMLADSKSVSGLKLALEAVRIETANKLKEMERLKENISRLQSQIASEKLCRHRFKARLQKGVLKLRTHTDMLEAENKALLEQLFQLHVEFSAELTSVQMARKGDLAKAESKIVELQDSWNMSKAEVAAYKVEIEELRELQHQSQGSMEVQRVALEEAKQEAAGKQMQLAELHTENEQLLQQMRMVQEELEQYFLENRALQDVIAQGHLSLDRSREIVSRLLLTQGRLRGYQAGGKLGMAVSDYVAFP